MKKLIAGLIISLGLASPALAQSKFTMPPPAGVTVMGVQVVATCGAASGLAANNVAYVAMDTTGALCTSASGGGGTTSSNITQFGGTNISTGTGVGGAGIPRVTVSSDSFPATQAATQSGTWTVQPGNTANTTPWLVISSPSTSGGLSVYNVQPTASDNHANIKNGAGQVYKIEAFNNSATVNYIRLYNAGTGFNGCNSATNLVWQGIIPASTSGAGLAMAWSNGMAFATGISICVSSGYAQTDTTNATASALIVNVGYK